VRSYGRSVQRARQGRDGDGAGAGSDGDGRGGAEGAGRQEAPRRPGAVLAADQTLAQRAGATTPITAVVPRQRVRVAGRVKSVRVQPRAGTSNLECVLSDGTGGILLVFQGRPKIAGIDPGARLVAEGMVGTWGRRTAMLNPSFEVVQGATVDPAKP
jgi:OB-fold nucleic acid binding domain